MVDGTNEFCLGLGLFDGTLVFDLRHVVGMLGVVRKGRWIVEMHFGHHVRDSHAAHEGPLPIAQHETTAFFRNYIEGVATDLVQDRTRDRRRFEFGVQINSIRHGRGPISPGVAHPRYSQGSAQIGHARSMNPIPGRFVGGLTGAESNRVSA